MSTEEQLQWEARLARPAAAAALAAGLLLLAGTILLLSIPDDRPGIDARPDFLLSVNDSPGTMLVATGLQAAGGLCLILVFFYMFRAVIHRTPSIPQWFVYIVFLGPAMYAVAQVLNGIAQVDVADTFAHAASKVGDCPAIRGQRGEDCAQDLLQDQASPVAIALSLAGSVATAFLFVMLPLRARRAGLLSQFMGVLGVIAGVLLVLPLFPGVPVVLQAFWLGAVGTLYIGRWPGGRGPAWDSGEPEPWPSAAGRRGQLSGVPGGAADDAEPRNAPEPEPPPERPSSRKRRRRKR